MNKAGFVRVGVIGASVPGMGPILVSAVKMTHIDSELAPLNTTGNFWVVIAVQARARIVTYSGATSVPIDLEPSSLILLPSDQSYRVDTRQCRTPSQHYWMQIDRTERDPRFALLLDKQRHCAVFKDPEAVLFGRLDTLIDAILAPGVEPYWLMQAHGSGMFRLLFAAAKDGAGNRTIRPADDLPAPDPLVDRTLAYFQSHMADNVRLKDIAVHLHVSPSTLSHRYRVATGEGPIESLHRMRLLRAKDMLVRGAPLKAITVELGYYDEHHFSRAFKMSEGVSPLEFARKAGSQRPMLGPVPGSTRAG